MDNYSPLVMTKIIDYLKSLPAKESELVTYHSQSIFYLYINLFSIHSRCWSKENIFRESWEKTTSSKTTKNTKRYHADHTHQSHTSSCMLHPYCTGSSSQVHSSTQLTTVRVYPQRTRRPVQRYQATWTWIKLFVLCSTVIRWQLPIMIHTCGIMLYLHANLTIKLLWWTAWGKTHGQEMGLSLQLAEQHAAS